MNPIEKAQDTMRTKLPWVGLGLVAFLAVLAQPVLADEASTNLRLSHAIDAYADAYAAGPLSNETAEKLFHEAVAAEESEVELKRSYLPKLEAVPPAAKAVRYLQIETKIRSALRYELADAIPLVE